MALDIYPNKEEQFSRLYSSCSILWVSEAKHGVYYLGGLRTLSVNLIKRLLHESEYLIHLPTVHEDVDGTVG